MSERKTRVVGACAFMLALASCAPPPACEEPTAAEAKSAVRDAIVESLHAPPMAVAAGDIGDEMRANLRKKSRPESDSLYRDALQRLRALEDLQCAWGPIDREQIPDFQRGRAARAPEFAYACEFTYVFAFSDSKPLRKSGAGYFHRSEDGRRFEYFGYIKHRQSPEA